MRLVVEHKEYPIQDRFGTLADWWDGRECIFLILNMEMTKAFELFKDNINWGMYIDLDPDHPEVEEYYDFSEYSKAGPVVAKRDGTILAIMGKPTELELALAKADSNTGFITEEEASAAYQEGVNEL